MKIGLIGAMIQEINLIKNEMDIENEEVIGKRRYYSGKLYGREVVLVFSRYGKVASASTVTTLIEKFQTDIIVFTGVAGAVSKGLRIGDIVIADRLLQYDMDMTALSSDIGKYYIPLINKDFFEVPEIYVAKAKTSAEKYIEDTMKSELSGENLENSIFVRLK